MKTLVATHVYLKAEQYLQEMFDSVSNQTDQGFDFFVFNYDINELIERYQFNGFVVENTEELGIPDARQWTIKYAKEYGYDLLIFIDADDVMAVDRVGKTKNALDFNCSFYYTNLLVMHDHSDFFDGQLPIRIESIEEIINCNCVGLSHLALDLRDLPKEIIDMNVSKDIVAYDWFIVSLILLSGRKGKLVNTNTLYRIHNLNTAGYTNKVTRAMIERTINVKKIHYKSLINTIESYSLGVSKDNVDLLREKMIFCDGLMDEDIESRMNCYSMENIKAVSKTTYWWNLI